MHFLHTARWPVRLALLILALLFIIALSCQWWLPFDPQAIDLPARLLPPDSQHWLGTDHLGRDIFSRLLAATRVSLGSVLCCLLLVLILGLGAGGCAGLLGGRVDQLIMRIADLFMTFPTSILSFFFVGVVGTGLHNVFIASARSHCSAAERSGLSASFSRSPGGRNCAVAAGAGDAGYRPYDAACRRDVLSRPRGQRADAGVGGDDQ